MRVKLRQVVPFGALAGLLMLLVGGATLGQAATSSYTTSFPLNENPISEGGLWGHLDPTLTKVMTETIGGVHVAHGTQSAANCSGWSSGTNCYDDSSTYLSGFSLDHDITCTVWKSGSISGSHPPDYEVELLLRWSDNNTPHSSPYGTTSAQGYEINVSHIGAYANIGRFKELPALSSVSPSFVPKTGDQFRAKVVTNGSQAVITAYWNGVQFITATDPSPYTKGNPGIGFYVDPKAANNLFGFSSCTANSLGATGTAPAPPTTLRITP